jgi:hypothetical protein
MLGGHVVRRLRLVGFNQLCVTHACIYSFQLDISALHTRRKAVNSRTMSTRKKQELSLRQHGQVWKSAMQEYIDTFRPPVEKDEDHTSRSDDRVLLGDGTKEQLKSNVDFIGMVLLTKTN